MELDGLTDELGETEGDSLGEGEVDALGEMEADSDDDGL